LSVKEAPEYYKLVLNILCMTYFVLSSITVFEAGIIWVTGNIRVNGYMIKSWLKNGKTKYGNIRNVCVNLIIHLKDGYRLTSQLTKAKWWKTCWRHLSHRTHIAVLHHMHSKASQISSRIENLIPSDNIIVLDW